MQTYLAITSDGGFLSLWPYFEDILHFRVPITFTSEKISVHVDMHIITTHLALKHYCFFVEKRLSHIGIYP